jgi:hypothetical protein
MRRLLQAGAMLLFAGALSASAANTDDPRLLRLDPTTREAVSAAIDGARREGLPTEPLVDKALEGLSKNAPGQAIVRVVNSWLTDLRRARQALGPASTPADVQAGATALRAGFSTQELEKLREAKGGARLAAALNTGSYLVNRGVPADTISSIIVRLVLASANEDQLYSLRQDIERDISGGVAAVTAASLRGAGLEQQLRERSGNSGGPGSTLPSVRGQSRVADPLAPPQAVGAVQGTNASGAGDGARPAGPRGKPKPKRP